MIFEFMKNHAVEFPIEKMAKVFKVSRAGYYKYINKTETLTKQYNKKLLEKIKLIYKQNRQVYGSPRIHAVLKKQGESCSRKRVAKIMKQEKIQAKTRKKWKAGAKSCRDLSKIAPNLVNKNFTVTEENNVWVTDITYIKTEEGWLYVSAILDLYSRKIVGLSMGSRIDSNLVIRSLEQAICHRTPKPGLILHSDQGIQYTCSEFRKFAVKCGIRLSMSAKGNCYDNAAMESFFHILKTEHTYFYNYKTRQESNRSIFEYIEVFYNRQRLHSTLNFMTPVEYELKNKTGLSHLGIKI